MLTIHLFYCTGCNTNNLTVGARYHLQPSFSLESSYDREMRERRERKAADEAAARQAPATRAGAERRKPAAHAMHGLRTHCWVVVLRGKRGVPEDFFIEPSTGETVSVRSEDYLGVEAVFSSKNFWVNMQDCTEGVLDMSYDLSNTAKWECVVPLYSCARFASNCSVMPRVRHASSPLWFLLLLGR